MQHDDDQKSLCCSRPISPILEPQWAQALIVKVKMQNKSILITGGSSGIGKQLARDLLMRGNRVGVASNDSAGLGDAVQELAELSREVYSFSVDVGETASVESMVHEVLERHGCPDVLVNCAGFATYRAFEETPMEEIERLVNVNLLGAMRCTHFLLPAMIARRSGFIVNIASIAGKMLITPNAVYGASKHGLVAWSEALRYELSRFGLSVAVICPGRVETAFFSHETFASRAPRSETRLTVPVETVSKRIIDAIEKKRFLTYVPSYYALVLWLFNLLPFAVKPTYGRLLLNRIESLYESKERS